MWQSLDCSVGGLRVQSPLPTHYAVLLPGGQDRGLNCITQPISEGAGRDSATAFVPCHFPSNITSFRNSGTKPYLLLLSCQRK